MKNDLLDIRVIGLGQASLDYLGRVAAFPREDEKAELLDIHTQCGGPASTALVTLARLGIKVSFIGSISDDYRGMEIRRGLEAERVDHRFLKVNRGFSSQLAFIAINEKNASRTIFWHRGTAPPLEPHDVDLSPFKKAEILHLDGLMIKASLEAARQAKNMGITVVMDGGTMRKGSLELVRMVDVLIASERFIKPVVVSGAAPENALSFFHELGPKTAVITMGVKGSIGSHNGRLIRQEAFPVSALDTTGAGDVYHGGYIYGILQGWTVAECMHFASAVAAMKCLKIGARAGIPTLEEVARFMEKKEKEQRSL